MTRQPDSRAAQDNPPKYDYHKYIVPSHLLAKPGRF